MRIVDSITREDISNPDLTAGWLCDGTVAKPGAFESIDNVTKFALADDDYERVQVYHAYTAEELAEREEAERDADYQAIMDSLPDAIAELSMLVSELMEGANNG